MNRAERRAKNTAWRVKQRLRNPPVVPEGWREVMKRMMANNYADMLDKSFVKVLIDEAERTPTETQGADQCSSPETEGRTQTEPVGVHTGSS